MTQRGWEIREDGTSWPVQVLSPRSMFGFHRVQREDGSQAQVYAANLRQADNIDARFVWAGKDTS